MLTSNGVPNDVIGNFNPLSIIIMGPILNDAKHVAYRRAQSKYVIYPMLRKAKISYGPVARITTGFLISTLAGIAYTVLCYKAYQTSPCGWYASTDPRCVDNDLFSPISLWWEAVPFALGGFSELFINVPAYGIAYARAPANMRGLVSAIFLFNNGFANIVNLATSAVIVDPYLVWDFGGPAIAGVLVTVSFWFIFKHIDKEEYVMSAPQTTQEKDEVAIEDGKAVAQESVLKFKFNTDNFMIHPWRVNSGRPVHVPTIRETLKQENIDYDDIGDGLDANVKASSRCVHQQRTDACGPRSHIDQSRSLYMSTKVSCSIM
ncbi:hypothetical protein E4U54_004323 [Claviceps lovelessii]|nr:hypothetical protein E4U54_004323 [Claviceps lovelessii]